MNRKLALGLIALLVGACGKGELDPASLNNNPFDPDYNGTAVFVLDTTFQRTINIGGTPLQQQVIGFHARQELFLNDQRYSVLVEDPAYNLDDVIEPTTGGGHAFEYVRLGAQVGIPVCIRVSLYNDQRAARAEEICATL